MIFFESLSTKLVNEVFEIFEWLALNIQTSRYKLIIILMKDFLSIQKSHLHVVSNERFDYQMQ